MFYVGRQDFESAIRTLRQELKQSPRNLKALNLLGIAMTGAGQIDQANSQFKEALRINPRFYPALKNLAFNEFTSKRHSEAKAHFEQVLKYAPEDEVANLYLAEIDFEDKHCGSALGHYEKSRVRVVTSSALILHNSECLLEQGQQRKAVSMLHLLPEHDAENHFQAGVILGRSGAYAEAAKFFGLARNGSSDPYTAGYNQTLMLVRSKDYSAAIRVAKELLARGYRRAEVYSLLSEAYLKDGRIQEAYGALRTATQIEPEAEDNYVDLAAICLDYANYELGLEIVDIGLRHIPNSDRLYLQRGVMEEMKGLAVQAEMDFTTANKLAPQKTLPYVALGMAWMQLGQAGKAVEVLRERTRLNRDDFMIPYIFGIALLRSGAEPGSAAEAEALAAFEASVRLNPNFSHARAELGKVLLRRGEIDRATKELEKAVAIDPADAAPAFQLAQAYRRKGQEARAQEMLARVSKIHDQERGRDAGTDLLRILKEGTAPFSQNQAKP